jgi:hypothetical protein
MKGRNQGCKNKSRRSPNGGRKKWKRKSIAAIRDEAVYQKELRKTIPCLPVTRITKRVKLVSPPKQMPQQEVAIPITLNQVPPISVTRATTTVTTGDLGYVVRNVEGLEIREFGNTATSIKGRVYAIDRYGIYYLDHRPWDTPGGARDLTHGANATFRKFEGLNRRERAIEELVLYSNNHFGKYPPMNTQEMNTSAW